MWLPGVSLHAWDGGLVGLCLADVELISFEATFRKSAVLPRYAQLIAVAAGVDPLALPDGVAFRLKQLLCYNSQCGTSSPMP